MKIQTAVVGHPIAHSLSPLLHNAIYAHEDIPAEMTAHDVEDIEEWFSMIRTTPLALTAVTLPHKQSIIPLLDAIDDVAKKIGAVNTIINREGVLTGYNTDIAGIAFSLKDLSLGDQNVLIVGAGGAARPVAYYLQKNHANIFCLNRDTEKAHALCGVFGGTAIDKLSDVQGKDFALVINTTPLGLRASDPLPIPEEFLQKGIVFDLIYTMTKLQKIAKQKGARVISGLSLFVAQGLEQERLWIQREIADVGYTSLLLSHLQVERTL